MSILNNNYSQHSTLILATISMLYVLPVSAADWWDNFESQTGFSEFAPPSSLSGHDHDDDHRRWQSGSSFNESNKVRHLPVSRIKNPWKPLRNSRYKKSFSSQRPWGNVPERKRSKSHNMRFHDDRFKKWSHQIDSSYHNNFMTSGALDQYDNYSLPFITNYGFPGSIYNSPLITPALFPGGHYSPYGIAGYPVGLNPYSIYPGRRWMW